MALLGATALGACSRTATTTSRPAGTPFSVTSLGSSYGIQARLEGSIAEQNRWVYLVVPEGTVRTYQLDRQDYWDLRLRAAVASCRERNVEIVSEGRASRLAPLLGLSRDSATIDTTMRRFRAPLELDVAIPPDVDPARSWVALVFEWPFQSVMATYTVHVNLPLNGSGTGWTDRAAESPRERCR